MSENVSIYSSVLLTLLVGSIPHYTKQESEMQSWLTAECKGLIKMSFGITCQN